MLASLMPRTLEEILEERRRLKAVVSHLGFGILHGKRTGDCPDLERETAGSE